MDLCPTAVLRAIGFRFSDYSENKLQVWRGESGEVYHSCWMGLARSRQTTLLEFKVLRLYELKKIRNDRISPQ